MFHQYSPDGPLSVCVGMDVSTNSPVSVAFEETPGSNMLIVGRSLDVALGTLTVMLLDLASQIHSMPDQAVADGMPPFSILDFLNNAEAGVFTGTAMSLPMPVKLERATDTAMTSVSDLQHELAGRTREPRAPRHPKFLFLCGLQAAHGLRSRGFYADAGVNPAAAKFASLLDEGAGRGVHSVIWCNSFANIALTLNGALRHFRHLIVLDGAGRDPVLPAEVVDGPADQAWYVDAEQGVARRLSPYALPSAGWCEAVVRGMRRPAG